ncbi:restriction endonuclease subunit S [Streptococcus oralis]|uniref:Type I restriction-modification system S subunit n=1 Tax=Streptococcus oralis subsp. oralis TaxID=1891914 RepID=A0A0F2DGM8_STROR|nr:restriction endonuclease subunit S [Streptococcus oralis]KEQ44144.1 type I restriction modification DNA specificity domain protein [Streptococcus oralis]KJQ66814.1 type I restriction-modification system S subunit [Streptococcus oralis subsp. oralis]KJQ70192.1 type I restriction-modification system S subunit [Streptococcus oralis subsp. oralis]MBZ2077863.1 restriction endonuclease subunit S [Streptococcus oralis]
MTRMKESGIDWIGQIPEEWEMSKIRYLVTTRSEKRITDSSVPYIGLENIESQTGKFVKTGIQVDKSENIVVEIGDVLFGKLRPYLRKYWRATFSSTASSEFLVFQSSELDMNFLYYAIQSDSFIEEVNTSTYGSKMPRASWEYIKNMRIAFPTSLVEQQKIADFLDKKTVQLDKAKALLEEQIQKLKDYRASLIYETVTKGLDKTVPMKDSGIDWIRQVPQGWGSGKVKYFSQVSAGATPDRNNSLFWNGNINWMSSGEVNQGIVKHTSETITDLALKRTSTKLLPNGTVMLALNGQGKTKGTAAVLAIESASNQSLASFIVDNKILNNMYLYYFFVANYYNIRGLKGEDRDGLNLQLVSNIVIPLFELEEQQKIVDFLDKKTVQIDKLIQIKNEQIDNINKQRQTLIYDYVTGKRRV